MSIETILFGAMFESNGMNVPFFQTRFDVMMGNSSTGGPFPARGYDTRYRFGKECVSVVRRRSLRQAGAAENRQPGQVIEELNQRATLSGGHGVICGKSGI